MRRRHSLRRKDIKRRRTIVIACLLGTTFLLASGYAAFSTALNINAKGNLIEVPKISPSDMIAPENIVTTGDGLYADPVETNRYVFKGQNPNNYITIGNEEYRIMSVESDGTLKVIKNDGINNNTQFPWDPGYSTSIAGVTEANSMTGTRWTTTSTEYCYYNTSTTTYSGCKSWGSSTTTLNTNGTNVTVMPREVGGTTYTLPAAEAYINTYLNTTYLNNLLSNIDTNKRAYIIDHTYNIGPVSNTSGQTLATDITQESSYKWRGKVGLMTATDYVKGSTNAACTSVREYYNTSECYSNSTTHNYLDKSYRQWTMSPASDSSISFVWYVDSSERVLYTYTSNSRGVRPVLYLSSDIKLKGSGTSSDKYEIA